MDCRLPGSWLLVPTAARCQLQVHTEGMREEPGARGEGLWRKRSRGQEERDCGRFSLSAAATPAEQPNFQNNPFWKIRFYRTAHSGKSDFIERPVLEKNFPIGSRISRTASFLKQAMA